MKKLILYLVKYFNDFTNHKMSPEQEAQSIINYMLLKSSTSDSIETFKVLEKLYYKHLEKQEMHHTKEARLIRTFLPAENIRVNGYIIEQQQKN